jgi:rhodanese-related sulfurtransferase
MNALRHLVRLSLLALVAIGVSSSDRVAPSVVPANPEIDMPGYLRVSREAAAHRESHRVTEAEFIRMSHEPGTIVLDARSREMYDVMHVKGAISLSFPDIAIETLQQRLPDKNARILIYCNNNFRNGAAAFLSKRMDASLNLSTYISLYSYGYRNVYELGPLLDIGKTKLEFEGTGAEAILRQARSSGR